MAPAAEAGRWAPRTVVRLGPWSCGGVPLKTYGILADAAAPLGEPLVAAAQQAVDGASAQLAATAHEGLGFVILHRGTQGIWLLLHWWVHGGICAQVLWRSEIAGPVSFAPLGRPLMACVWELALIDYERRAYVRTVMAGRGPQAYLADIYRQDFC
ncbi:hypothetical protein [Labrys wisconsinensis]|uniref:Uncharacterized protein n=1 Tax=Labrys wisconsinensis TaxID=425677 RepID=A0ABU0IYY7_9HYPH|nr:hypothetical protein [Labrys wisconsinensis]MDQ0467230.1 hypothetical protein [Labrys wisconsinensis]